MHARRIQVFIHAAPGMHAVKAADHEMVNHIHHRLGHRIVDALKGINPFLHQYIRYLQALFYHRHFIALLAIKVAHFAGILNRHDAHAVGARVRFDNDERRFLHPVFGVFHAYLLQHSVNFIGKAILPLPLLKIDFAALSEIGINQPRINIDQLGEFGRDAIISGEVSGLAPRRPARHQRRDDLLLQIFQNLRHAG